MSRQEADQQREFEYSEKDRQASDLAVSVRKKTMSRGPGGLPAGLDIFTIKLVSSRLCFESFLGNFYKPGPMI
jgi:hypothetical protein